MTTSNGSGLVAPRHDAWVDVPGYPGFKARVWTNPTRRNDLALASDDEATKVAAFRELLLEHNGWCDADGEPYPPTDAATFFEDVSTELLGCALVAIREATQDLPNSLRAANAASRSGSGPSPIAAPGSTSPGSTSAAS